MAFEISSILFGLNLKKGLEISAITSIFDEIIFKFEYLASRTGIPNDSTREGNIKKFDIPALKKIYNFSPKGEIFDTLEYARRLWPKIIESDNEENRIPIELRGRHSLKAWGYRLTNQKADYEGPWDLY